MAYPEYSNIELFQGEDFEMTVDLSSDASYSMLDGASPPVQKTFKAYLAADYDTATTRVAFTISDIDTSLETMKLKLSKDQTQSLSDDFDGYWDLMEKDAFTSTYTRLLQGEAKIFPQVTKDEDWA